jgi:thymidylate kinase
MAFHNEVYRGYVELSKKFADRFIKIDCSGKVYETHSKIIDALKNKGIL